MDCWAMVAPILDARGKPFAKLRCLRAPGLVTPIKRIPATRGIA
jgi:hypothetical protein